jgi:NAD(P)-binding Rossmann-like domain
MEIKDQDKSSRIADIVDSTTVPDFKSVFFIGPFAKRVSFASQQHRALNLVWALVEGGHIKLGDNIAVVGGGLAGLTACAALLAKDCTVTLFEKNGLVLERQRNTSHRFVHPTINNWPFNELSPTTSFPFLDWYSNTCNKAMRQVEGEWQSGILHHLSDSLCSHTVKKFRTKEKVRVIFEDGRVGGGANKRRQKEAGPFDAAIVTTGFGDELAEKKYNTSSYWSSDDNYGSTYGVDKKFIVSGIGDGGLIDALRLTHKDFDGGEFVVRVAERTPKAIAEQIKQIELGARGHSIATACRALSASYNDLFKRLPKILLDYLDASLMMRKHPVLLISRAPAPYSVFSAPIHKLLLTHALKSRAIVYKQAGLGIRKGKAFIEFKRSGEKRPCSRDETLIARHGASNTLRSFLNKGQLADLEKKQVVLMDRHDRHFWPFGYFRLKGYPPHDPADRGFVKSRYDAAKVVAMRYDGIGSLEVRKSGFELVVDDPTKMTLTLPEQLFGIPLMQRARPSGRRLAGRIANEQAEFVACSGAKIRAAPGHQSGTIGALVANDKGEMFGLTAAHVLASPSTRVVLAASGEVIGMLDADGHPISRAARRPIGAALGIFRISSDALVSGRCTRRGAFREFFQSGNASRSQ